MQNRPIQWLTSCAVLVALAACSIAHSAEHTRDSLDTVKQKLKDKKAVLVDVREEDEWNDGHVRGAKFVPLSRLKKDVNEKDLLKRVPKDKIVYCHCRAGKRCLTAADILKKHGYDVRPLKPGYDDLIKAGFPESKAKEEESE
jgi:rhodanese-related sulfurtransferase